jgi:hypothetical protein
MKATFTAAVCAALMGLLTLSPAFSAPKAKAAAEPPKGQYTSEADAKASCPSDTVVWANLTSKVYHASGSKVYGKTKKGAYMCEKESVAAGFRAPKPPAKKSKTA